ncbi:DUF2304 domain-containing protein [Ruminococcaceae bacterium OttesenSCG-928-A16]|nr:DUF2304 domain-containing protein [Ruminococcaceae bacterium OttesenSCG-928-A16]
MLPELRIILLLGAIAYLLVILALLKKGKLNVQYSLIWLASAVVLIIFAAFPYTVYVLRDLLNIEVPANLVFLLLFIFVLALLLSLSTIVTGFASRIRKLTQTQALLEKRLRELEETLNKKE